MKTYKFNFNTQYAVDLRDAVNDRPKQSIDNEHDEKQTKGAYCAWERTCAAMDRLQDTIRYLNSIELGKNEDFYSAFDFYDFINNAYVVIDCIKTLGSIFRIDINLIKEIEDSTSVFGTRLSEKSTDQKYFEYIRSLCSVHPLCTNHQAMFLSGSKFHCCSFVTWRQHLAFDDPQADLCAVIYLSNGTRNHGIYISQFEKYLTKWIELIPKIREAKNNYTDKIYEKLRKEHVKELSEFGGDVVKFLSYLKAEYCKRFDYGDDFQFDVCADFFTVKLSDSRNYPVLEKFRNAIVYSLQFFRNALQNMSYEKYENSGLKYPNKQFESTLFDELLKFPTRDSVFLENKYNYHLSKMYHLDPRGNYGEGDKYYARCLLEEMKELINRYVYFTNLESDVERVVLVRLALYLEALTRKCLLNKNIPNTQEYRMQVLSDEEFQALLVEDESQSDEIEDLQPLLKRLGIDDV